MNKTLLLGAVSALLLNGCAAPGTMGAGSMEGGFGLPTASTPLGQLCNTGSIHCIDVSLGSTSAGPFINAINDLAVSGANHLILWKTSPSNLSYTFPDNGIEFKQNTTARSKDEFLCKVVAQRQMFICINRNSTTGTTNSYEYKVTLTKDGASPLTLDPKIVNQ